jgi:hypothetical protein
VRADLDPRLLYTTVMSLPLIHLISLSRFAAMFPDADFTSPAALAHAREQITELVLRGILSPTIEGSDSFNASHTGKSAHIGRTAVADPTQEA